MNRVQPGRFATWLRTQEADRTDGVNARSRKDVSGHKLPTKYAPAEGGAYWGTKPRCSKFSSLTSRIRRGSGRSSRTAPRRPGTSRVFTPHRFALLQRHPVRAGAARKRAVRCEPDNWVARPRGMRLLQGAQRGEGVGWGVSEDLARPPIAVAAAKDNDPSLPRGKRALFGRSGRRRRLFATFASAPMLPRPGSVGLILCARAARSADTQ